MEKFILKYELKSWIVTSSCANAGDYVFLDKNDEYVIFRQGVNLNKVKDEGYRPIAVVTTPGSHNIYGDCSVGCIALNWLSQNNVNGVTTPETIKVFNISSTNLKTKYYSTGTILEGPQIDKIKGFIQRPGIPLSSYKADSSHSLSLDGKSRYNDDKIKSNLSMYGYGPSPYLPDGKCNETYWYACQENKYPRQRAIDGEQITKDIIAKHAGSDSISATVISKYYPKGAQSTLGKWYIPQTGEYIYISPKNAEIDDNIKKLAKVFGNDIVEIGIYEIPCYTFQDNSRICNLSLTLGLIGDSSMTATNVLRAYIRVNTEPNRVKINFDWSDGIEGISINGRVYYVWDDVNYIYVPKDTIVKYKAIGEQYVNIINPEGQILSNKEFTLSFDIIPYKTHIKGSYAKDVPESDRYVWINGIKYPLAQTFDCKIETPKPWIYGNDPVENTSSWFGPGLKSLTYISGTEYIVKATRFFGLQDQLEDISGLSNWDMSNVTHIDRFFNECSMISDLTPIKDWNTSNVIDMTQLFYMCKALTNISPIMSWNVSKVTTFDKMFRETNLETVDLSNWNFASAKSMRDFVKDCPASLIAIPNLNISKVSVNTDYSRVWDYMFSGCAPEYCDLSGWDVSKYGTYFARYLTGSGNAVFKLDNWKLGSSISYFGQAGGGIDKITVYGWDTSKVKNISAAFSDSGLKEIEGADWDLGSLEEDWNVGAASYLFVNSQLSNIKVNVNLSYFYGTGPKIMAFINGLSDKAVNKTITLRSDGYDSLLPEHIAVATSKGWSVIKV